MDQIRIMRESGKESVNLEPSIEKGFPAHQRIQLTVPSVVSFASALQTDLIGPFASMHS